MKYFLIILSFLLVSCSAEWHMRRAIHKNPRLGDSTISYIPYYKDTNIVINIIGDTSDQTVRYQDWYKQAMDSMTVAYNDSFVIVNQQIDSLGNLKTEVVRKPYEVEVEVIIHDTIPVKVPPSVIIEEVVSDWIWGLGLIALILLLILLIKIKK